MSLPYILAKMLRLIFLKWYTYVFGCILVITFFVFQGLQKAGVIEIYKNSVVYGFTQSAIVAKNCTPLIKDLKQFLYCIQNPEVFNKNNSRQDQKMMDYISSPANIDINAADKDDGGYYDSDAADE